MVTDDRGKSTNKVRANSKERERISQHQKKLDSKISMLIKQKKQLETNKRKTPTISKRAMKFDDFVSNKLTIQIQEICGILHQQRNVVAIKR